MESLDRKRMLAARMKRCLKGAATIPFGVTFLDEALGGISPGDIVLLGARTGAGKTQLATQIALNASRRHKKVWFYALEADSDEIANRLLYSEMARQIYKLAPHQRPGFLFRYSDFDLGRYDMEWGEDLDAIETRAWSRVNQDMAEMTTIYRDRNFTVNDFCKSVVDAQASGAQLIILDHLHYFDWSPGSNEQEELKKAVKLIRDVALRHEIPIILIAHLRKKDRGSKAIIPDIDEFHGSSDISKIATKAIMLARAPGTTKSKKSPSYLYIAKARAAGDAMYYAGLVAYDISTGSYDDGYILAKVKYGEPEIIIDPKECPPWTKNVRFS